MKYQIGLTELERVVLVRIVDKHLDDVALDISMLQQCGMSTDLEILHKEVIEEIKTKLQNIYGTSE